VLAQGILDLEVAQSNTFSVASVRTLNSIRSFVDQEIGKWQKRGVRVSVRESPAGETLILHCQASNQNYHTSSNELHRKIKSSIANGLSDIIIDEYEKFLVVKLIDANYGYLSGRDRELLKKKALRILGNGRGSRCSDKLGNYKRSQRKSRVWAKLSEYLEREDQIIVEGFITFRLKEYLEDLFDFVDHMVKEHLINREYREFLQLLRHFMSRQKYSLPVVNVHRDLQGCYRILNAQLEPIQGDLGVFLKQDTDAFGLDVDDLVVSAIVTLAPNRIVWHGATEDSSCFDLLNDLFNQEVEICHGCELERDF